jgi:hypothetical protein
MAVVSGGRQWRQVCQECELGFAVARGFPFFYPSMELLRFLPKWVFREGETAPSIFEHFAQDSFEHVSPHGAPWFHSIAPSLHEVHLRIRLSC